MRVLRGVTHARECFNTNSPDKRCQRRQHLTVGDLVGEADALVEWLGQSETAPLRDFVEQVMARVQ